MKHLLNHNIIPPTQHAFRLYSNWTLALQTITDNTVNNKQRHNPTTAVYVDLYTAYNTASQKKNCQTQKRIQFLTRHSLFLCLIFPKPKTVTLHPPRKVKNTNNHTRHPARKHPTYFFLFYINNIIRTVPNSKVYTYADDTTLIITAAPETDLQLETSTVRTIQPHHLFP